MDIERVNGVLTKAIMHFQGAEVQAMAEAMAGTYRVPSPSELSRSAKSPGGAGRVGRVPGRDAFITPTARLTWDRHTWKLEELPQKGKKKLRVSSMQNPDGILTGRMDSPNQFIPENILMYAKLSNGDSFDRIKAKLDKSIQRAISELKQGKPEWWEKNDWIGRLSWTDNSVHYLKVVPEGTDPIVAKGKDFRVKSEWTKFSAYSPDSEFGGHDPSYTQYASKSPTGARKLYKILKADPGALSRVSWNEFSSWLRKMKIHYSMNFSQYR